MMCFSLEKPGAGQVTTWDMLRAGLLLGVLVHGLATTRRLVQTKAWFEERERSLLGERAGSVASLERVAVLPSRQGRGVGSAALASAPYPYPNPNANPIPSPNPSPSPSPSPRPGPSPSPSPDPDPNPNPNQASALQEMDALGLAVFLTTQEERNVTFYRRLGFAVIADEICPIGATYRCWMMLREPNASAS